MSRPPSISPHPRSAELSALCIELLAKFPAKFEGLGFRYAALKYASPQRILSGLGAIQFGGRINSRGSFPVIYTSTDPSTATKEVFQNLATFGISPENLKPRVIVALQVRLALVLDLGDARICNELGLSSAEMSAPWQSAQAQGEQTLSQAVGHMAREAGFEAILIPSMRQEGGTNLNIFPDKLLPESLLKIIAEDDLTAGLR